MNKSEIRKKIFRIRKKNHLKDFSIDYNRFFKFLDTVKFKNKVIGGYYPYNYEFDTLDILKRLEKKNYKIALPKVGKNNLMNFYNWSFKDPLSINVFGIPEPIYKKKVYPDILLVPFVAFDNKLNRLGYGGGYYDRYLSRVLNIKKIKTIGIGYSYQKIIRLPVNEYDMKLDHVITEKNFF